jgi:hypothetical protein
MFYYLDFIELKIRSVNRHIYNVEFLCARPLPPYTRNTFDVLYESRLFIYLCNFMCIRMSSAPQV